MTVRVADEGLRSGQVAASAGVNLQTLRFYERRGLLEKPDRSLGGHRRHPSDAVTTLRVIKAAQRLGFTLDEVSDFFDAARHRHQPGEGAGLRARPEAKLVDIEARIADLHRIERMLHDAIDAGCEDLVKCASTPGCPLPFAELADSPVREECDG